MGPDLKYAKLSDIVLGYMRARNYLFEPIGRRNLYSHSAPKGRGEVTERDASLHSGSTDSVQNSEAELQNFEAQ